MGPIIIFVVPLFCVGLLIVLVSGWMRGGRERATGDACDLLSRFGFALGTSSALTAVATIIWTRIPGLIDYHDPKLGWIYAIGALFALLGLVLSILGAMRKNLLRWHALIVSAGMLLIWCVWVSGE
jgi:hypothetical protein